MYYDPSNPATFGPNTSIAYGGLPQPVEPAVPAAPAAPAPQLQQPAMPAAPAMPATPVSPAKPLKPMPSPAAPRAAMGGRPPDKRQKGPRNGLLRGGLGPRGQQNQNSGWNPNTGSFYAPSESAAQLLRQQQALDDYARTGQWNYAGTQAPTELFSGDFIRDVASQEAWGKNLAPMPTFQQFTSQATDASGRSYSQYDTAAYDKAMADWRNQALASFMDYRQQGNQGWQSYGDPAVQQWLDQQKQQILAQGRQRAVTSNGQPIERAARGATDWANMILSGTTTKGTPLTDGNIFQGINSIAGLPGIEEAMPWVAQWKAASPENTVPNWLGLTTEQRQNAQYQWARQGADLLRQYTAQNPNWQQAITTTAQKAADAYAEQQWNDWMQSTGQPALDQYRQQGLGTGIPTDPRQRREYERRARMMKVRPGSPGLLGGGA